MMVHSHSHLEAWQSNVSIDITAHYVCL